MKTPNFFIVGAPRCGTTALYTYLRQHPDIFMPEAKEPHYFATDLGFSRAYSDRQKYLALFQEAENEQRIGEASVWNLYSTVASSGIKEFCPQARIIIMLRKPADMMYSLHSQSVFCDFEDITSFQEALEAEEQRKRGERIPKHVMDIKCLYYRETVKYTEQVRRYLEDFAPAQIKIVIYDDFKKDVARTYREVCQFLDVAPTFVPNFEVINDSRVRRSMALRRFIASPKVHQLGRVLLPGSLQQARRQLKGGLDHWNTKTAPRSPMSVELMKRLEDEFVPEIDRLSELLGRDLVGLWS